MPRSRSATVSAQMTSAYTIALAWLRVPVDTAMPTPVNAHKSATLTIPERPSIAHGTDSPNARAPSAIAKSSTSRGTASTKKRVSVTAMR